VLVPEKEIISVSKTEKNEQTMYQLPFTLSLNFSDVDVGKLE
jgi:hypothetical protein